MKNTNIRSYRKKPVVIEAIQFTGSFRNYAEILNWTGRSIQADTNEAGDGVDLLWVPTPEGTFTAVIGNWIIKGVKGEIYPCDPDIFEATYEAVEEGEA